jgi:prepilin-type N-terminal cleavage/methylation domain-containing protein
MHTAIYTKSKNAGFTLVEIMLVVAIIALLAAIAIPSYQRARKRAQAASILNDLRVIDNALDQWAIENKKTGGDVATFDDLRPYLKRDTVAYSTGRDVLGHDFGPSFTVDLAIEVPADTFAALQDVAPAEFWSPFRTSP